MYKKPAGDERAGFVVGVVLRTRTITIRKAISFVRRKPVLTEACTYFCVAVLAWDREQRGWPRQTLSSSPSASTLSTPDTLPHRSPLPSQDPDHKQRRQMSTYIHTY